MENLSRELALSDQADDIQVITTLLRSAREFYLHEQVINPCFPRFAQDFLNLTRECGSKDTIERGIYDFAHGVVSDMLCHSPAKARALFAKESIPTEFVEQLMSKRYVATKSSGAPNRSNPSVPFHSTFCIAFPESSCDLIAAFANEVSLFMRRVDKEDMRRLFVECEAPHDLRLRAPGLFALFMKNLYDANLVCKGWRYVIEENKLLKTCNGNGYVSHSYLANALSRMYDKKRDEDTNRLYDTVKAIIETV